MAALVNEEESVYMDGHAFQVSIKLPDPED